MPNDINAAYAWTTLPLKSIYISVLCKKQPTQAHHWQYCYSDYRSFVAAPSVHIVASVIATNAPDLMRRLFAYFMQTFVYYAKNCIIAAGNRESSSFTRPIAAQPRCCSFINKCMSVLKFSAPHQQNVWFGVPPLEAWYTYV